MRGSGMAREAISCAGAGLVAGVRPRRGESANRPLHSRIPDSTLDNQRYVDHSVQGYRGSHCRAIERSAGVCRYGMWTREHGAPATSGHGAGALLHQTTPSSWPVSRRAGSAVPPPPRATRARGRGRPARRSAPPLRPARWPRRARRGTARGSGRRSSSAARTARRRSRVALAGVVRAAHPRLPAAGEQHAAQDGLERLGLDVGAGARGDRLGRGVGLLRGEPALLDREGDRVARRPDGGRCPGPGRAGRTGRSRARRSGRRAGAGRRRAAAPTIRWASSGTPSGSTISRSSPAVTNDAGPHVDARLPRGRRAARAGAARRRSRAAPPRACRS